MGCLRRSRNEQGVSLSETVNETATLAIALLIPTTILGLRAIHAFTRGHNQKGKLYLQYWVISGSIIGSTYAIYDLAHH